MSTVPNNLVNQLMGFPHIQARVRLLWGTVECKDYLHSLTVTDRVGRKGFPFEVMVAINELIYQHNDDFPNLSPNKSVWDDI